MERGSSVTATGLVVIACAAAALTAAALRAAARPPRTKEAFSLVPATPAPTESHRFRLADEITMHNGLNGTGVTIVDTTATTQCTVSGVPVMEMEVNTAADSRSTSCFVSRSLLKPIKRPSPELQGLQWVQHALKQGPVVSAFCRPDSTLCTVQFSKAAPAASVREYNAYLTATFGFAASTLANVSSSGTMYVMMPDAVHDWIPKRTTVRVDADGSKHVLAYKYCAMGSASPDNPMELWRSGGRNKDSDTALSASDATANYCSDVLTDAGWEALQFSHVAVEVRRGPETLSRYTFKATKDRAQWFHPQHLVSAQFGRDLKPAPAGFANRAFSRFRMDDADGDRLYWTILDDIKGVGSASPACTDQRAVFLAAPFRSRGCALLERLHGRVVSALSENPTSLEQAAPATHLLVWLVVSSAGGSDAKADEELPPYVAPARGGTSASIAAQGAPSNPFAIAAAKPTKERPCVLGSYTLGGRCASAKAQLLWHLPLSAAQPYTRDALESEMAATRAPIMAVLSNGGATPSLPTLNLLRFHRSFRVVLVGEGRDFAPDASYVAVLHDIGVLAAYGYGTPNANMPNAKTHGNVRFADGRTTRIAYRTDTTDNDGSFLDVCLDGEMEGSARSIIIEKVVDVPVQASRKCNQQLATALDVLLHVGVYDSARGQQADLMANAFGVDSLRSFRVGAGYSLTLFAQPGLRGRPMATHVGPHVSCLRDGEMVRSFAIRLVTPGDAGEM